MPIFGFQSGLMYNQKVTNLNNCFSILFAVHNKERKFQCEKCSKYFAQKVHLQKHTEVVHDGIKRFKCGYCTDAYGQKVGLQKHVKKMHKEALDATEKENLKNCVGRFNLGTFYLS